MTKWNYTLEAGIELRDAIDREDPEATLDALEACFIELNSILPEEYDESELEGDLDEITAQRDNLENFDEYDIDYDDVIGGIDYICNDLYDICDALGVWVEGV